MLLKDDRIRLRAMEPEDGKAMYRWENDATLWRLGDTTRPFSRAALEEFVAQAAQDIYQARQLRLMIELLDEEYSSAGPVGCVDLFDFDPLHRRAGVGILIYEPEMRRRGYGTAALRLLVAYAFGYLDMRQLWADVPLSNAASLRLFGRVGFRANGVRQAWVPTADGTGSGYEDVRFFQLLRQEG